MHTIGMFKLGSILIELFRAANFFITYILSAKMEL